MNLEYFLLINHHDDVTIQKIGQKPKTFLPTYMLKKKSTIFKHNKQIATVMYIQYYG